MIVTPVESSTLAAIGYDNDCEQLRLEFRNDAAYQYFSVPVAVYQGLLQAPSKGGFFNRVIRGRFYYCRVSLTAGYAPVATCRSGS